MDPRNEVQHADGIVLDDALTTPAPRAALVPSTPPRRSASLELPQMTFDEMLAMGEHLVRTNFLPKHIRTGAQAAAIMLAGH